MKTLFVTDLDGTLLRRDQTLSEYSAGAINDLVEGGMIFSFATARSSATARAVLGDLSMPYPAVVYNGAFIVDMRDGRIISSCTMEQKESAAALDLILSAGIAPRVFSIIDGKESFTYTKEHLESEGAREYFRTRKGDKRARLSDKNGLYSGDIFIISCVDKKERLEPLYEMVKDKYQCHFYLDDYSSDWYLELLPKRATKANGVLMLRDILGCDRIVCFGDGVNDRSMFDLCDEAYAVKNAHPELLEMATGIIGSNEEDGVAKYLLSRFEKGTFV